MTCLRHCTPLALLLVAACGGGRGGGGGPAANDAAVSQRVIDYFQKTVTTPGLTFKVTIVEYSDFQCPFCSRVYTTVETQVLKEYGDKVRFIFKNYPLTSIHPWAEDAAVASECGFQQGNDQFWTMYNGLFSKQGEINKDNLAGKAAEIAEAGGLDVAKFKECLEGKKSLDAVKADESEATALGVNST